MDIQQLHEMQLDEYRLVDIVGQGGMSAVYRAYQEELERYVAVKILSPVLANDPGYAARFTNEAKMAASLEHPHIVPVYDFGVVDDLSYVVMRLLRGGTLKKQLAHRKPISVSGVMQPVDAIAKALDYAHTRNIIHRDVKPGNIMFDEQGTAYLVDFGIARAAHYADAQLTAENTVLGTPAYMAPEQWRDEPVSAATDQYALAVVVYWMLTGTLPFDADSSHGFMHRHLNTAPIPGHKRNSKLTSSVTAVLERALAKDPADRYPGITNFRDALHDSLTELPASTAQNLTPVQDTGPTQSDPAHPYKAETFPNQAPASADEKKQSPPPISQEKRNRPAPPNRPHRMQSKPDTASAPGQQTMIRQIATGGILGLILLAVILIGGGLLLYNLIMPDRSTASLPTTAPTVVTDTPAQQPTDIILTPRTTQRPDNTGFLNPQALQQIETLITMNEVPVRDVAYSPDGHFIAAADGDGQIQLWRDGVRSSWNAHATVVSALDFSPDSSRLVSGGRDDVAIIWSMETQQALVTLRGHTDNVRDVAFSPDGSQVATASEDGTVRLWNAETGVAGQVLSVDSIRVLSVAFHPDGNLVAAGGRDATVHLYDVNTGAQVGRFSGHREEIRSIDISPDGNWLVSGSTDNTVRVWEIESQASIRTLTGHTRDVFDVTFSADGTLIISGGRGGSVRLWNRDDGTLLNTLDAHAGWVLGVDVHPDNTMILSGGGDGAVHIWGND